VVFPGVNTRIYVAKKYESLIKDLLDSPGNFILAYYRDDTLDTIYETASIVSIEDFNKQKSGVWELSIKSQHRIHLSDLNKIQNSRKTGAYRLIHYLDEEFISHEEEMKIRDALQVKIKKNFPDMAPHLYSELIEKFTIAKFLHYLCFSSRKNKETKIKLLGHTSLYKLYRELLDSFMK
jgi:hypothetical protein